jgi:hypothetical protein
MTVPIENALIETSFLPIQATKKRKRHGKRRASLARSILFSCDESNTLEMGFTECDVTIGID